ncbi:uncharacterized protein LOC110605449 [Manihot esculenta]|uniref:uncharacterized protein LOC110605449 n=1 Tax=Manihot esculenta TaxID=3983 RepID=UPI000B5D8C42|nr:uncharacterized protein LOC110605449 [Manihot esculenta]
MIVPKPDDKSAPIPIQSKSLIIKPPFPERLAKSKREKEEKEILKTFHKIEINTPLLDATKQVPRYAKFLKELYTNKRKLVSYQNVCMDEKVSTAFQSKMPIKCKDQAMFTIPIKIGIVGVKKAMCDLGVSINVMPLFIYQSLNVDPLKETGVVIQLADRSVIYPEGVLENVLIQVDNLVFLANFYIVHMDDDKSSNTSDLLLGRPFLTTARTKIDIFDGTLTMEFDGKIIKFNVYDSIKYPNDFLMLEDVDYELEANKVKGNVSTLELPITHSKLLSSIMQALRLELKSLSTHINYAYLGVENSLPVIISNMLTPYEEEELL